MFILSFLFSLSKVYSYIILLFFVFSSSVTLIFVHLHFSVWTLKALKIFYLQQSNTVFILSNFIMFHFIWRRRQCLISVLMRLLYFHEVIFIVKVVNKNSYCFVVFPWKLLIATRELFFILTWRVSIKI